MTTHEISEVFPSAASVVESRFRAGWKEEGVPFPLYHVKQELSRALKVFYLQSHWPELCHCVTWSSLPARESGKTTCLALRWVWISSLWKGDSLSKEGTRKECWGGNPKSLQDGEKKFTPSSMAFSSLEMSCIWPFFRIALATLTLGFIGSLCILDLRKASF